MVCASALYISSDQKQSGSQFEIEIYIKYNIQKKRKNK